VRFEAAARGDRRGRNLLTAIAVDGEHGPPRCRRGRESQPLPVSRAQVGNGALGRARDEPPPQVRQRRRGRVEARIACRRPPALRTARGAWKNPPRRDTDHGDPDPEQGHRVQGPYLNTSAYLSVGRIVRIGARARGCCRAAGEGDECVDELSHQLHQLRRGVREPHLGGFPSATTSPPTCCDTHPRDTARHGPRALRRQPCGGVTLGRSSRTTRTASPTC